MSGVALAQDQPRPQRLALVLAAMTACALYAHLLDYGARHAALLPIGLGLGVTLYHAAFGFASAYRRALVDRDITGVTAQLLMLAAAIVLFAPILAEGQAFGQGVTGAVAPVSVSMVVGAFVFGIGMQMAGGCASGTLYTAGGGNLRMVLVLVFFCVGGFWGSLNLHWWVTLPGIGPVSLPAILGWEAAVAAQLAALAILYALLRGWSGRNETPLWQPVTAASLVRGPWPLLLAAGALAGLNALTLIVAGHPWSITWAFALWVAKGATAVGWDAASSPFWSGAFQQAALARPVLADTVSVMNIGILLGAFGAAAAAGHLAPSARAPWRSVVAAVIGGLAMGYGARLAYGCNIGALFSGVASGSLHGWAWLVAAVFGSMIGVRLRPLFRLPP